METHPPRKWIRFINQKNIYITNSRQLNCFLLFYFWNLTVKSVLIPLKHTFEYSSIKTKMSKEPEGFWWKLYCSFPKRWPVHLGPKDLKKRMKVNIKKKKKKEKFWIYLLRSETGILLGIFLNIFKCLSKFPTLAIQQVFFVSIGILFEFAMLPGM